MPVYHFEGVPRSPLAVALKNVLTLGIHTKVWLYRVNREMDGHEGFHIDLRWLALLVTLPFVTPIVVKFQTARRLNQMVSHQVTLGLIRARRLGWISVVPIIGSGFFAWWVQSTLNKHWFHHRREERLQLMKDQIAALEAAATPEAARAEKRERLADEVAAIEREIGEELEAARLRWGEERFEDRMKRAALHEQSGGRMSRKDLAALRAEEKRHRAEARAARKAARGRLFGLLPAKANAGAAGPDPDDDAQWQPKTPLPSRTPQAIRDLAEAEGRDLTEEEEQEVAVADEQLAARDKEVAKLEAQREKLRVRRDKAQAKQEAKEEAERLKKEKADEKARRKQQKADEKALLKAEKQGAKQAKADQAPKKEKPAKPKKEKRAKKGKKKGKGDKAAPGDAERIPIEVKPRTLRAPATIHEAGAGPLRTLTVKCPRCRSEIQGIRKRGDAPAKITCPTCHLVGKI